MNALRIPKYSSLLRLFTFLAIATFLASSGRGGNALASPLGGDTNDDTPDSDSTPEASGYPSNRQMKDAFLGVLKDQTVIGAGAGVTPGALWIYASSTRRVSIYNAFRDSVNNFFGEGYGPEEGFSNFYERCSRFLIRRSSGKVWLLSNWPNGPDESGDCKIWRDLLFPLLTQNPKVTSIWLVNQKAFYKMKQIWPETEKPKSDEGSKPDPPNSNRKSGGRPSFILTPPLVGLGAAGLTLGGGIGGLGTLPLVAPYDKTNDPGSETSPAVKTDVLLDDIVGSLPSTSNEPAGGDGTGVALGTQGMTGTGGTDASGNIEGLDKDWSDYIMPTRRDRVLQARSDPACSTWFTDPSTIPYYPSTSAQGTGNTIEPPPSAYVAPGAFPSVAKVQVTQYEENNPTMDNTGHCHLQISIMSSADEVIGGLQPTDAPPGQDLKVTSNLPYALLVSVGSDQLFSLDGDGQQNLMFKYAWDTPYGKSWDMNDKSAEHDCQIGPWNDGIRGVYCSFSY